MYLIVALYNVQRIKFQSDCSLKLQLCYIYLQTGVLTGSQGKQDKGIKKKTP